MNVYFNGYQIKTHIKCSANRNQFIDEKVIISSITKLHKYKMEKKLMRKKYIIAEEINWC